MRLFHRQTSGRSAKARNGTAALELALCLPMMVILTFGAMESTDLIFLKAKLKTAAYEGARTTTAPSQTSAGGITAANNVLQTRGIVSGTVSVNPSNVTQATATGTVVTVTVTAPFASNMYMKPFILGGVVTNVSATVTMIRQ